VLDVVGLSVSFGPARVLRHLSFSLGAGETLGIVGESGSGKTMTALAAMGLLPPGARAHGALRFEGRDMLMLDEAALTHLRGKHIAMVFQEPTTALNPVHRVGDQIAEGLVLHEGLSRRAALAEAEVLLAQVGIDRPAARLRAYPHQLSGGQRQRAMIAMALACRPALLVADEPTSALDVTVQAEVIALLGTLLAERSLALLLISHDLGVVAALCARVLVLYGGAMMEEGETRAVLARPRHPYTRALLGAQPRLGRQRLEAIPGTIPPPAARAAGCPFHGRCPRGDARCADAEPPKVATETGAAWCWHPMEGAAA